MNNNFFKNLGIGKQGLVNKWIKDNNPKDVVFKNIIYNDELGVFRVVSCSQSVFSNLSYYFVNGKLNEHIIYDFEKFSEINVTVTMGYYHFLMNKSVEEIVEEIVELVNKMDKHILNLKRVYIQKNDPKNPRLDSCCCIERYNDGWRINTYKCEIWYEK